MFSRVLSVLEIHRTESGDLLPNVALYQTEPHLVIDYFLFLKGYNRRRSGTSLRSALPVATKPLSSKASFLDNRQVAATPFCSLYLPQAAVANAPKQSRISFYAKVLYHKILILSSNFGDSYSKNQEGRYSPLFFVYQLSNFI